MDHRGGGLAARHVTRGQDDRPGPGCVRRRFRTDAESGATNLSYTVVVDALSANDAAPLIPWIPTHEDRVARLAGAAKKREDPTEASVTRCRARARLTDISETDNRETGGPTTATATATATALLLLALLLALLPFLTRVLFFCTASCMTWPPRPRGQILLYQAR